jgi:menaquinone-dependent protoporphyrinogen IX oxidase
LGGVKNVGAYDAVVIGAPMIVGWHPKAVKFVRRQAGLQALKFPQMVFVMLLFAEKPREYRNWENIRGWAADLRPKLFDRK